MANKTTQTAGTKRSTIDRLGGQKFIVLLVVIALFIFFSVMSPNFRKYTTFVNILDFSYYITLMAIGVAFPLMTGGVDLSIGTGLVCYSLVGGYLIVYQGWPTWAGMLVSILMGCAVGVLNGCLVALMDLPPFLATLWAIGVAFPLMTGGVDLSIGTGLVCYSLVGGYLIVYQGWPTWAGMLVSILMGCAVGVLNGCLVALMDLPPFLATLCTCMITRGLGSIIVGGFGISWPAAAAEGGWFRSIFKIQVNGTNIPIGFIWIILLVILMTFVLNHTKIGRYTLAIGSNKEATRLSGVNVKFYHIFAYVISGFFAGLAAISYSAIFATVQPGSGAGFELEAIGGAIIGGVSMSGGAGSITGTLAGVFVICMLKTGLPFIGLTANWQQIITGFVLIAAVLVDILKRKNEKM